MPRETQISHYTENHKVGYALFRCCPELCSCQVARGRHARVRREEPTKNSHTICRFLSRSYSLITHSTVFFLWGPHSGEERKSPFFTLFSFPPEEETKNYEREERKLCGRTKAQQQSMDSSTNQSLNLHTLVECSHIST